VVTATAAGAGPGTPIGPPPIATPLCPANNAIDTQANTNSDAEAQQLFTAATNVGSAFPIAPAMNQCLTNLMNIFSELPTLADPLGLVGGAVTGLITGLIGQVCSAVIATITSAQNALLNLTKICLPLPTFGGIDLPQLTEPTCAGGLQLNFLSGFASPSATAAYNYSQYLQPE
ncbi:MAG: hypothetical protein WCD70_08205, partial [Alphaproteobacteria bacterium]